MSCATPAESSALLIHSPLARSCTASRLKRRSHAQSNVPMPDITGHWRERARLMRREACAAWKLSEHSKILLACSRSNIGIAVPAHEANARAEINTAKTEDCRMGRCRVVSQLEFLLCADFVEKAVTLSFGGGADAVLRKPPYLAGPIIRIASGRRGINRDGGDELCQPPQILGGRGKQEFVASAAWSSQPQSSEPQDPLKMCK